MDCALALFKRCVLHRVMAVLNTVFQLVQKVIN